MRHSNVEPSSVEVSVNRALVPALLALALDAALGSGRVGGRRLLDHRAVGEGRGDLVGAHVAAAVVGADAVALDRAGVTVEVDRTLGRSRRVPLVDQRGVGLQVVVERARVDELRLCGRLEIAAPVTALDYRRTA